VISALVNWISFYISFIHLHSHYAFSAIIAFIIATAANYFLSAKVGFLSNGRTRIRQFLGVYLVSMLGLCVDLLVLVFLYDYLEINVMTSKIAGTSAAFFVNFAGRQAFVFLRQPRWSSLSAIPRELSVMASRGKPNSSAHRSRT
jgi:putative flippase GtrA